MLSRSVLLTRNSFRRVHVNHNLHRCLNTSNTLRATGSLSLHSRFRYPSKYPVAFARTYSVGPSNENSRSAVVTKFHTLYTDAINLAKFYWRAFGLLHEDWNYAKRLKAKGTPLTRAELRLVDETKQNISLLIFPFSCFLWVPFSFYAIPFVIKYLPHTLPTRFISSEQKKDILDNYLKNVLPQSGTSIRKEFDVPVIGKDFEQWLIQALPAFQRKSLESLSRETTQHICRALHISPYDTSKRLCQSLSTRLRHLINDAKLIRKEGLPSLSRDEVVEACLERGICTSHPESVLRYALETWLEICVRPSPMPESLLLTQGALGTDMAFVPSHVRQFSTSNSEPPHNSGSSPPPSSSGASSGASSGTPSRSSTLPNSPPSPSSSSPTSSSPTSSSATPSSATSSSATSSSDTSSSDTSSSDTPSSDTPSSDTPSSDTLSSSASSSDSIVDSPKIKSIFTNQDSLATDVLDGLHYDKIDRLWERIREQQVDRMVLKWDEEEEAEERARLNFDQEAIEKQKQLEKEQDKANEERFRRIYAKKVSERLKEKQLIDQSLRANLEKEFQKQDQLRLHNFHRNARQKSANEIKQLEDLLNKLYEDQLRVFRRSVDESRFGLMKSLCKRNE